MTILLLLGGAEGAAVVIYDDAFLLHAGSTNVTMHASRTAGSLNSLIARYYMTDESGNRFTDESGNLFVLFQEANIVALHARPSDYVLHAPRTTGQVNTVLKSFYMTDESGNIFTDESGNRFVLLSETNVPLLHAGTTSYTVRTGETI